MPKGSLYHSFGVFVTNFEWVLFLRIYAVYLYLMIFVFNWLFLVDAFRWVVDFRMILNNEWMVFVFVLICH